MLTRGMTQSMSTRIRFHLDRGLFLTKSRLAIDVRRRQPAGFISHAHADHMAPHELAICTPETSQLYQHRSGKRRTLELPFGRPLQWRDVQLTTFPAGHVLGSAMLLVEDEEDSLLYTGDFNLDESATAEKAELPQADILITECTFGTPQYRLPPRGEVCQQLVDLVSQTIRSGTTPVIHAYVLGKSQEVTKILSRAGIPVQQHPLVYEISRIYEKCGTDLGHYLLYQGRPLHGHAIIAPPRSQQAAPLEGLVRCVRIGVTGWAGRSGILQKLGVDHVLPLSDHADYDQLLEAIERVQPQEIYCTHGPKSFVTRLREAGHNAFILEDGQVAVPGDTK